MVRARRPVNLHVLPGAQDAHCTGDIDDIAVIDVIGGR
jgi:hypothetical protein